MSMGDEVKGFCLALKWNTIAQGWRSTCHWQLEDGVFFWMRQSHAGLRVKLFKKKGLSQPMSEEAYARETKSRCRPLIPITDAHSNFLNSPWVASIKNSLLAILLDFLHSLCPWLHMKWHPDSPVLSYFRWREKRGVSYMMRSQSR